MLESVIPAGGRVLAAGGSPLVFSVDLPDGQGAELPPRASDRGTVVAL